MIIQAQISSALALCLYTLAAWVAYRTTQKHLTGRSSVFRVIAAAALMFHAVSVWLVLTNSDELNFGFFVALSSVGLLVALLLMALDMFQPAEVPGYILLPLCGLTALAGCWLPSEHQVPMGALGWHIAISMIAYAILILATAQALLLDIQSRYLRQLRQSALHASLPPIDQMERLLFQMIGIGFVLLSGSLLSGLFFIGSLTEQRLMHSVALSVIAWLIFGILLFGRARWGWRGTRARNWMLLGLSCLIVGYFGSKLILELILQQNVPV